MWGPQSARDVVTHDQEVPEAALRSSGRPRSFDSIALHPVRQQRRSCRSLSWRAPARLAVQARRPRRPDLGHRGRLGGRGPDRQPLRQGPRRTGAGAVPGPLARTSASARTFNLRGVFWYSWRDKKGGDSICDWCGHAGPANEGRRGEAGLGRVHHESRAGDRQAAAGRRGELRWRVARRCSIAGRAGARAPPKRFFGVDPQGPLDRRRLRADGRGQGRARCASSSHWAAIDPARAADDYDWSSPDAIVAGAAAQRHPRPALRARRAGLGARARRPRLRPGSCRPYPPQGRRGARRLARLPRRRGRPLRPAAASSGPRTRTCRTCRSATGRSGTSRTRPPSGSRSRRCGSYAKLLGAAHEAITRARPRAPRVILGGMFGTPLGGPKAGDRRLGLPRQLYRQQGAKQDFDGVAPHPYAAKFANVRPRSTLLRDEMADAGDERAELWITELGWASGGAPQPLNRGLAGQADRLRRVVQVLHRASGAKLNIRNVDLVLVARQPRRRRRALRLVPGVRAAVRGSTRASPLSTRSRKFTGGS